MPSLSSWIALFFTLSLVPRAQGFPDPTKAANDCLWRVHAHSQGFHQNSLDAVIAFGDWLASEYPPDNYTLLLPGRSLSGVGARLQNTWRDYAHFVPYTLGRYKDLDEPLTDAEWRNLKAIFDEYVPVTSKAYVVADYSSSGATSVRFVEHLQRYLAERGRTRRIVFVPISQRGNFPLVQEKAKALRCQVNVVNVETYRTLWHDLQHELWDGASPHGQYYVYRNRDPHRYAAPTHRLYGPRFLGLRYAILDRLEALGRHREATFRPTIGAENLHQEDEPPAVGVGSP